MNQRSKSSEDRTRIRSGCLVAITSLVILVLLFLAISVVVERLFGVDPATSGPVERYLIYGAWLTSVAIGSYVAANRSPFRLRNALWVGSIAFLFLALRKISSVETDPMGDFWNRFGEFLKDPQRHTEHLIFMALVLPASLLSGLCARAGASPVKP